jgi:hypothetical protein
MASSLEAASVGACLVQRGIAVWMTSCARFGGCTIRLWASPSREQSVPQYPRMPFPHRQPVIVLAFLGDYTEAYGLGVLCFLL